MKSLRLIGTIGMCFAFLACGTIFKGSSADVRINSSPSGAQVFVNDINRGTTPQSLSLKRNRDYVLDFRRDGYESVKVEVNKTFDLGTTVVGNIFSWGLLGIVVDLASGAAYSLEPADLQANMRDLQVAGFIPEESEIREDEIHVIMISKEEWESINANNSK